jgi:hypothetical protein
MAVDASVVVALTLANEMIGAMGVVARRAVDVCGEGDAAVSGEAGAVAVDAGYSRGKNAQAGQIGNMPARSMVPYASVGQTKPLENLDL